ncbi:hypothetical protein [Streptomyces dysideae]|uniref:hypothetical protein n=1 Tax=Streptomyces dysideae TaxID=909626 RepID=UPI00082B89B4|nr:hypothetical protein [Streptomyces dysideae]
MSETPVPIPSGSVPAGTPAWSSSDAAQWAQAGPASWARPMWSVPALLVTVVWAIAVEPVPPCSDAAPCGPDWAGMVQVGLAVGLLYWLVRLPELTLVAAPALAAMVAWRELPGGDDRMSQVANVAVIVALVLGWGGAWERLAARSRQRRITERAAGVRHRLPKVVGPLARGRLPIAAGLVLCAVAGGAVLWGLRGIRADEHHAARAVHITAKVISRGEETVQVRTVGERLVTVDAFFPEDYGVGSTVTVLEDGSWRRLVAEPYDAFDRQALALAAGLPALSLLAVGVLVRRRFVALRRGPVPALCVLERTDLDGRTWVYAADDTSGRTGLFTCFCAVAFPEDDEPVDGIEDEDEDEVEDEEEFPVYTQLHEAVLFGVPYDGGELVLVTTDLAGDPITIHTADPVRLPRAGKEPFLGAPAVQDTDSDTTDPLDPLGPLHQDRTI